VPFTQTFQGEVREVYNVDGTLILDRRGGTPELAHSLAQIKAHIAALPDLEPAARQRVQDAVDAALAEARSGKPNGGAIKARLDGAAETIKSASGVADSSLKLAETLLAIGKWAVLCLA
jgi:hypothetical protein